MIFIQVVSKKILVNYKICYRTRTPLYEPKEVSTTLTPPGLDKRNFLESLKLFSEVVSSRHLFFFIMGVRGLRLTPLILNHINVNTYPTAEKPPF